MCSRYYFDDDTMNDILNIVEETDASLRGMRVNRNIYPTDNAAVMIRSTDGIKLAGIRWGYPGINGSGVIINAGAASGTAGQSSQPDIFMSGAAIKKKIHSAGKTGILSVWQGFMTSRTAGSVLSS